MSGWTKLFASIVTSTIWLEPDPVLRVWIAMLALADAEGRVEGSVPGFANVARVTTEQMRVAVEKFSSPDPDSRTADHEGRRIEVIDGGWRILNYRSYRERGQAKDGSRAPYYRSYRQRKSDSSAQHSQHPTVARNTEAEAEAEAEAEESKNQSLVTDFGNRFWPAYPRKVGRKAALRAFMTLAPSSELLERMLSALEQQKVIWARREIQYVPHPATWLRGDRWNDEPDTTAPRSAGSPQRQGTGRTGAPATNKYNGVMLR